MVNETGVTVTTSDMSVNNKLYYINLCQVHLDNIGNDTPQTSMVIVTDSS